MTTTYRATVWRDPEDEHFWLIEVDLGERTVLTQARRLAEVDVMATDLVATWLDVPAAQVQVDVEVTLPDPVRDIVERARRLREDSKHVQADATQAAQEAAVALAELGLPVRDIGSVLGVSHQRAHQLTNAA